MKKLLIGITIGILVIVGVITQESIAQQEPAPNVKISVALTGSQSPPRLLYQVGDPIPIKITLENQGSAVITSKGFMAGPFHLFLVFVGPDGKGIVAKELEIEEGEDAPPPPVVFLADTPHQAEAVETIPAAWVITKTMPNAHAYYNLLKAGHYSVKAVIAMRTYGQIDYSGPDRSRLTSANWEGHLESNPVYFTLVGDFDRDEYQFPESLNGLEVDCNDNDPNEHPGQIWYKDLDNDGYTDNLTVTFPSCKRPEGYKLYSELLSTSTTDCDDTNRDSKPGLAEVTCNGVDDDCNPATPDVAAPALGLPANGATNVSTTPVLFWTGPSCATSYWLQVARNSGFTDIVTTTGLTTSSYTFSTPLLNSQTYYWRVNARFADQTSPWSTARSFTTQAAGPTGTIKVKAVKHVIGLGSRPIIRKEPIVGMEVRAYNKSTDPCVTQYGIISWPHYSQIWNTCTAVASGTTNASGEVNFQVAPRSYLIIGKYDPSSGSSGGEILVGDTVFNLLVNQTRTSYLYVFSLANGKYLPGKYTPFTGSSLLVIEPEVVEWSGTQELYPFVFESEGDWTIQTAVAPPEGFRADINSLGATVNTDLKAVQFTITDVGSRWMDTQVQHRIKHKGKWKNLRTRIGVRLSERLARERGLTIFGKPLNTNLNPKPIFKKGGKL